MLQVTLRQHLSRHLHTTAAIYTMWVADKHMLSTCMMVLPRHCGVYVCPAFITYVQAPCCHVSRAPGAVRRQIWSILLPNYPTQFVRYCGSWCVQGVPVRVEVGPRDVQQGSCVVSRRDQPGKQGKQFGVPLDPQPFVSHVQGLLQEIQDSLYADVSVLHLCSPLASSGDVFCVCKHRMPHAGHAD